MIRNAQKEDIPSILSLLVQVGEVHHKLRPDLFRSGKTKYSAAQLEEIVADPERPVFVCEEDEKVVGHAFCEFIRPSPGGILTDAVTLYVDDICVDEKCRGRGVGKLLFEHVRAFAVLKGCHNLTLNVWAGNDAALKFYEKCGFVPQKTGMEFLID
ncbi:MAG: GNAT family N-acetyltransferase [Clostridia bacterium]|nr:GNAT family N-acetyltransferase [Clostridia bacterium]